MARYTSSALGERLFRRIFASKMAQYAEMPGVKPRLPLGNAGDFLGTRPPWEVAAEHARRSDGPPVIWLLGKPVVVLAEARSIEAVLSDQSGMFEKDQPIEAVLPVTTEYSMFTATQKTGWKEKRARHPFSHPAARAWDAAQIEPMRQILERRISGLVAERGGAPTGWRELLPLVRRMTFDAFAVAAVGHPLDDAAWNHFMAIIRTGDRRLKLPVLLTQPLSPLFYWHRSAWYHTFDEDIARARSAANTDRVDLLATMLQRGFQGDDRTMAHILGLLFVGGVLSSSVALLASLFLLGNHPEAAGRLRATVRKLTENDRYDALDLQKAPYVEAVIREAMRLLPPIPLFMRQVSADGPARIGEHEIPADATLWIINANAHRDPERYAQPLRFLPERWLDGGFARNPIGSGWFFPFGSGPRMCVGTEFAMTFLQVALTAFVKHTDVEFKSKRPYRQDLFFAVVAPKKVEVRFHPAPPDAVPERCETRPTAVTPVVSERPPLAAGLPWVGSVANFLRRPLEFFTDEVDRLGPVFRMRILGEDTVVVSAGAGAALIAAEPERCPLTRVGMFRAFATETEVDMFGADGAQHKRLRKMVRLGYSRHVVAQFVPDMVEITRRVVDELRAGDEVKFQYLAEEIALRCIMTAITPVDLDAALDDIQKLGDNVMYVTTGLRPDTIFKLPGHVAARTRVGRAIDEAIERHRAGEFADHDRMRMLDALLSTRDDDGQPLGARGVRGSTIYALCGTHVYVGRLITFLVYEILRDHDVLQRVRREVDAAFAQGPLSADVFRRMRSLRGAYIETLRMYPLVTGLLFRAARDFEVGGYLVDEGESVLVTSIPDHYDPVTHAKPFHFDAGRGANRYATQKPGSFSPFGLRPRVCAAAGLVEVVVMTATAAIFHCLRLRLPRPTYQARLALQPLLGPADGLPLVVARVRTDIDRIIDRSALAIDVDDDPLLVEQSQSLANFEVEAIHVEAGEDLVREGEPPDWFYVIISGTADVYQKQPDGVDERVASLTSGQIFGELGLLKGRPRNATVRAREPMGLLRLDRDTFLTLVAESDLLGQELGRLLQRRFMRKAIAEALPRLSGQLALSALEGVKLRQFAPGEVIIQQGDPADHFYILAAGKAEVLAEDGSGGGHLLAVLEKGAAFGEIGILTRRPRTATVRVSAQGPAVVMQFNRDRFEAVVAESPDATQDLALIIQRRILRHLETIKR